MNTVTKQRGSGTSWTRRGFLGACAAAGAGASLQLQPFQADARPSTASGKRKNGVIIPSTCNMCVNRCGIRCHVIDGKLEKIDGDPRHPRSRGGMCAKGQAGVMALYDPDRITHPLIRTGARGEGKWRQASWDEAFDYTATKMAELADKYGPETFLWSSCTDLTEVLFVKFGKYFGTPNFVRHTTLCLASRNAGYFGVMGGVPDCDLPNAKYVLMFGANRMESFELPYNADLLTALANGAKVVTVDPRESVTAAKGVWVPIRPRTDMALTLALMHVLIAEDLYDKEFVANATTGFEELKAHVAQYTPEWAAAETDIPADNIIGMAREMAAASPAVVIFPGRRSSWYTNDTQFRQSMAMLTALLGAFDARGANFFGGGKVALGGFDWELEPVEIAKRVDGFDEESFPLANHEDGGYVHLRDAVLNGEGKYPIKGWMLYKQNPVAAVADQAKTFALMDQMEFICAIDVQPSQTAWMADVILPEQIYLERLDPVWAPPGPVQYVSIRQPAVKPQGEAKSLLEIIQGLSAALDTKHQSETPLAQVFNFTMEDYVDAQLAKLPIDRATLMREGLWVPEQSPVSFGDYRSGKKQFKTPSGKIEFASERFRRNGYDPLPVYEPVPRVEGKQRLVTGRYAWFTHASNQNNRWLNALHPENELWIHPDVAREKEIRDGELIRVRSSVGEVQIKAYVTPRIRPDTVFMTHGFGTNSPGQTTLYGKGAADQVLMEAKADLISNNQALHETLVEILKA